MRNLVRVALCIVGLLISVYLTALHYDSRIPLVCHASGIVDCQGVLTSPQSTMLGLPVALYGILWFLVMGALALTSGRSAAPGWITDATLIWTLIGAGAVAYLVYAELGLIGRICIWCTSVHVIVIVLFLMEALHARPT